MDRQESSLTIIHDRQSATNADSDRILLPPVQSQAHSETQQPRTLLPPMTSSAATARPTPANAATAALATSSEKQFIVNFDRRCTILLSDEERENLYSALGDYRATGQLNPLLDRLSRILNSPIKMELLDDVRQFVEERHLNQFDLGVPFRDLGGSTVVKMLTSTPAYDFRQKSAATTPRSATPRSIILTPERSRPDDLHKEDRKPRFFEISRETKQPLGFTLYGGPFDGHRGVYIKNVLHHSIADSAGLRPNDRILDINDVPTHSSTPAEAADLIERSSVLRLHVLRSGDPISTATMAVSAARPKTPTGTEEGQKSRRNDTDLLSQNFLEHDAAAARINSLSADISPSAYLSKFPNGSAVKTSAFRSGSYSVNEVNDRQKGTLTTLSNKIKNSFPLSSKFRPSPPKVNGLEPVILNRYEALTNFPLRKTKTVIDLSDKATSGADSIRIEEVVPESEIPYRIYPGASATLPTPRNRLSQPQHQTAQALQLRPNSSSVQFIPSPILARNSKQVPTVQGYLRSTSEPSIAANRRNTVSTFPNFQQPLQQSQPLQQQHHHHHHQQQHGQVVQQYFQQQQQQLNNVLKQIPNFNSSTDYAFPPTSLYTQTNQQPSNENNHSYYYRHHQQQQPFYVDQVEDIQHHHKPNFDTARYSSQSPMVFPTVVPHYKPPPSAGAMASPGRWSSLQDLSFIDSNRLQTNPNAVRTGYKSAVKYRSNPDLFNRDSVPYPTDDYFYRNDYFYSGMYPTRSATPSEINGYFGREKRRTTTDRPGSGWHSDRDVEYLRRNRRDPYADDLSRHLNKMKRPKLVSNVNHNRNYKYDSGDRFYDEQNEFLYGSPYSRSRRHIPGFLHDVLSNHSDFERASTAFDSSNEIGNEKWVKSKPRISHRRQVSPVRQHHYHHRPDRHFVSDEDSLMSSRSYDPVYPSSASREVIFRRGDKRMREHSLPVVIDDLTSSYGDGKTDFTIEESETGSRSDFTPMSSVAPKKPPRTKINKTETAASNNNNNNNNRDSSDVANLSKKLKTTTSADEAFRPRPKPRKTPSLSSRSSIQSAAGSSDVPSDNQSASNCYSSGSGPATNSGKTFGIGSYDVNPAPHRSTGSAKNKDTNKQQDKEEDNSTGISLMGYNKLASPAASLRLKSSHSSPGLGIGQNQLVRSSKPMTRRQALTQSEVELDQSDSWTEQLQGFRDVTSESESLSSQGSTRTVKSGQYDLVQAGTQFNRDSQPIQTEKYTYLGGKTPKFLSSAREKLFGRSSVVNGDTPGVTNSQNSVFKKPPAHWPRKARNDDSWIKMENESQLKDESLFRDGAFLNGEDKSGTVDSADSGVSVDAVASSSMTNVGLRSLSRDQLLADNHHGYALYPSQFRETNSAFYRTKNEEHFGRPVARQRTFSEGQDNSRPDDVSRRTDRNRKLLTTIRLDKTNPILGLSISGGCESKTCPDIVVDKITAGSASHVEGSLKPGMKLLSVDGQSLVGVSHMTAVGIIKNSFMDKSKQWMVVEASQ